MSSLFKLFNNQFGVFTNTKSSAEKKKLKQHKWLSWLEKIINVFTSIPSSKTSSATKQDLLALFAEDDKVKKDVEATNAKLRKVLKDIDSNKDDVELLNHVLRLIAQFRDKEALADVAKILNEDIDLSTKEHALETLITLDPNLENKVSRDAVVDFLRNSDFPFPLIKIISEKQDSFLWLKELIEKEYNDPNKTLKLDDLKLLNIISILKPQIADYAEQLAESFMFNDDDHFLHEAIDVLTEYYPKAKDRIKPLLEDHLKRLTLSTCLFDKSLVRKIQNYTGEKVFPSFDSDGHLQTDFLNLQRGLDFKPRSYQIGETSLNYDQNGKPARLENENLGLRVQFFYNINVLSGLEVSYNDKTITFVPDVDIEHSFTDLPINKSVFGKTSFQKMKVLNPTYDTHPFVLNDSKKFVLYDNGCIQIPGKKKIIVSPNGSVLISNNVCDDAREFITSNGEYYQLELNFG